MKNPYKKLSIYGLRHLIEHILHLELMDRASNLLSDPLFIEAKCAADMTHDLIHDYDNVIVKISEREGTGRKKLNSKRRLDRYIEDLLAFSKGERSRLDIISSIPIQQNIDIDNPLSLGERETTRLDRLRAFSHFVDAESHGLIRFASHPGFCIQQAYNSANSGPVESAAHELIQAKVDLSCILGLETRRRRFIRYPTHIRTIEVSHGNEKMAVCHQGAITVSGSLWENHLEVWRLDVGKYLHSLTGASRGVTSVDLTPDGRMATACDKDGFITIWDARSGGCLKTIASSKAECVVIAPDGSMVVAGGRDGKIRVWIVESGERVHTLKGHTNRVNCLAITANKKRIVSGSKDKILRIWDLETGRCRKRLHEHTAEIKSLAITPDGAMGVSGGLDFDLYVWRLDQGYCSKKLWRDTGYILSAAITPDGRRAVCGSDDNLIQVWDLSTGRCVKTLKGHSSFVGGVWISPDGARMVSGGHDRTIRCWRLDGSDSERSYPQSTPVKYLEVAPDWSIVVASGFDANLYAWDFNTGEPRGVIDGHTDTVFFLGAIPGRNRVITTSDDHTIRIWDVLSGACLKTIRNQKSSYPVAS